MTTRTMTARECLSTSAARMLAVEILLADPEALADDVLESSLYLLREKLRTASAPEKFVFVVLDAGEPGGRE